MPKLSMIIPAFNEEERLPQTLAKSIEYLKRQSYDSEIIVVDDGSSDKTVNIAEEALKDFPYKVIKNDTNHGKGYSVRKGMLAADGDYRLFSDADLSTPIEELENLLGELQSGADIAIGSRGLPGSDLVVRQPLFRELMGRTFNIIVQILLIPGIKDTQCGFKLFTANAADKVFSIQKIDGWAFDVEALFIARKLGLSISEIPVRWLNSAESRVNPISAPVFMLLELFKIRLTTRIPKS